MGKSDADPIMAITCCVEPAKSTRTMESEREHWDGRYRGVEPPWDTGRPSAELQRRLAEFPVAPCRAIEPGCGTGSSAVWLAQQGFEITGIDISPIAIERAKKRAGEASMAIQFLTADVTNLPDLGAPFEFFFDRGCYHAVRRNDGGGYLREIERIIAPGAMGIVLTGNSRQQRSPGPPAVSEDTIRREWGRAFVILSLEEFLFDQDETDGHRHLGWSCVLRRKK